MAEREKIKRVIEPEDKHLLMTEEEDGKIAIWNKSGIIDKGKLLLEKWLLVENQNFDDNRLIHLRQYDDMAYSEKSREEYIAERIAQIDEQLSMLPQEMEV